MEDSVSHVISKGQASKLIGRRLGMGVVLSQSQHTGHEVASLSNHPAGTKQIVLGHVLHESVTCGLGLSIYTKWSEFLILGMQFLGAIEHVITGDMH